MASVAIIGTRGYPSYYGGFETLVRELAPYLVKSGWDVTVYGRKDSTMVDDQDRDRRVHSVRTIGIESKSLSTLSYGLSATIHALWRRPDVVLVLNVANGFWLPLLRLRGIPSVVNVDGIEWERQKWGKNAKRVFRLGAKATATFATELVFDALEIARYWKVSFQRSGTYIAYGGKDPGPLAPVDGLERGSYILMVARFVPENTVEEFIAAAQVLSVRYRVVIVGSSGYGGPVEVAVKELAERSQKVHWMGHVSDDRRLFSLWSNCGLYFHGHSVGGTNPALVQAMACGAPVLARDTPFNREVLLDAAEYVAPDRDSIVERVSKLMEDETRRKLMSEAARKRGSEAYTWQGVCAAYDSLLANVARKA